MKTVLQELIEEIEASQQRFIDLAKTDKKMKKGVYAILTAITIIKIKAKSLLEKEKQQIIEAYRKGFVDGFLDDTKINDPENYFEQTFNQPLKGI